MKRFFFIIVLVLSILNPALCAVDSITLTGNFNNWNPTSDAYKMALNNGVWEKSCSYTQD